MRASWDAQKEQLTKALTMKHLQDLEAQKQALQKEKDEAVDYAKRQQWVGCFRLLCFLHT